MIEKAKKIVSQLTVDGWLIYSSEHSDKYFSKLVSKNISIASVLYISSKEIALFVHTLDYENVDLSNFDQVIQYGNEVSLTKRIQDYFSDKKINEIALNFTTQNDVHVDTLGHGTFLYLQKIFSSLGTINLVSAENIIYEMFESKTKEELEKMSLAAERANEILKEAFDTIEIGMTEKEVVRLVHTIKGKKLPEKYIQKGVVKEEYSWNKDMCPIVLTGKSFTKGGHALSSDEVIKKGNTVYFDFGVKFTFQDGTSWSSDIQRTGYVLKDGENKAPEHIQKQFDDIITSISLAIREGKPEMYGYEIDNLVRSYLNDKGYVDYDHATGHAIGELAHNPGTIIANRKTGSSAMKIKENGTYTIEPRIPVENGVSVEEMVVYSSEKNYTLCERQTELILINGNKS